MKYHNGKKFSTKNRNAKNCAKEFHGAWWYNSCAEANLNGQYDSGKLQDAKYGTHWRKWPNQKTKKKYNFYPLKLTEMKLRRI